MTRRGERPDPAGNTVFVALGSNLGRREARVLEALRMLESDGAGRVIQASSLYETDAVEMDPTRPFINALAQVRSLLSPEDLLIRLKTMEKRMGRSGGHLAPREIDLDLIAYGGVVMETPELTLPHPRYDRRSFVLIPLREVAPGFRCPRTGRSIDELMGSLDDRGTAARVSGRWLIARRRP